MLTYVVGFDGTEASRAAVRFAAELGSRTGAEVIAAHVYSPLPAGHPYAVVPALGEEERKRRADAERVVEALDEEGIERRAVPASSPAHGLQNLVEQENAALVAVGTTHHGALGRLVPGGEAERLLHGSPCPVAVVPAGAELGDIRTIAVAYDGGDEARAALPTAEALARRLGARLLLLAAVDPSAYGRGISESRAEREATAHEQARRMLTAAAAGVADGVRVESRVALGPAREALVHASRDDVDLLVMGSRAYGPLRSVLLGSVSRHVVDHAPCPVIVVPRGARAALVGAPPVAAASSA